MTTKDLPKAADVVIIGAGIVGCSAAYFLAKRGVKAVVLEKGTLSNEQSGRNWGWIRQQGRNPREIPLIMLSIKLWSQLAKELDTDIEFIQAGSLKLAYTEKDMAHYEEWTKAVQAVGLDTRMLTAKQVKELFPALEGPYLCGVYTPGDAQAEPRTATEAVAIAAQKLGAKIFTHCAVEGINVSNRSVIGVVTQHGEVKTSLVLCAAGAWSSKLARMVSLNLPQRAVRATVSNTTPAPIVTHTTIFGNRVALRQRRDGSFNIAGGGIMEYEVTLDSLRNLWLFLPNYRRARRNFKLHIGTPLVKDIVYQMPWSQARKHPFAHLVDLEPKPNPKTAQASLQNLLDLIPSLGELGIRRTWAGLIDATPDATPVLGEVPNLKGFVIGTGFSGHGFAMGPGAGFVLSELIRDGKTSIDLHPLRFSRFKERDLADWSMTI